MNNSKPTTDMKVLLADDSALILDRLKTLMGMFEGVEIVGSMNNGSDTLVALRDLKPELAVVDLRMPGLTGLDVLTEIRRENHSLKFIMLTLYSSAYFREMAIQYGADYFFSKVDEFEKVGEVVAGMLMEEKQLENQKN